MNLISKVRHVLKTAPTVGVTIRPLTEKRRISLILATADDESRLEDVREDVRVTLAEVGPAIVAAKEAQETGDGRATEMVDGLRRNPSARRLVDLHGRCSEIQRRIDEAVISAAVVAVDGLTVDGVAVDVDGFIEFAPVDVFSEVAELARASVGLTEEDRGNSGSLITSAA